jgi:hypothetical protein
MMPLLSDKLQKTVYIGLLGMSLIAPLTSQASLLGETVSVAFVDNSLTNPIGSYSDTITLGSGHAIASGDGSHIGSSVLLDGEFINIGDGPGSNTGVITFNFQGGGTVLPNPQASYNYANYNPGDYYTISGLSDPSLINSFIQSVSISFGQNSTLNLPNAVNVQLNQDVFFTANSVTLDVAQIGILNTNGTAADYGSVSLNLQFAPTIVPIPASILFFISGLSLIASRAGLTRNPRVLPAH